MIINRIWKLPALKTTLDSTDAYSCQLRTAAILIWTRIVVSSRGRKKYFYSRASRQPVKKVLHRIGITKPHKADYLLRTLLGDSSSPNDLTLLRMEGQKVSPTSFSPVTSTNGGISSQNFLTFTFNCFAILVENFKAIRRASPKLHFLKLRLW